MCSLTHASSNVREVGARRVLVEAIAADAGPRREVVLIAVWRRRHRDVVQRRKLLPDPRPRIVLIGDGVDAQLGDQRVELLRTSASPEPAAAPARACWRRPTRAPISGRGSDRSAALIIRSAPADPLAFADRRHPKRRLPGHDNLPERIGRGKSRRVLAQVRLHLGVGIEQLLITSGRTLFRIHVDVEAINPSTSN